MAFRCGQNPAAKMTSQAANEENQVQIYGNTATSERDGPAVTQQTVLPHFQPEWREFIDSVGALDNDVVRKATEKIGAQEPVRSINS
jgi:hypothetical protein